MKEKIKIGIQKLFSTGFFHVFGSNVINKVLAFFSSVMIVRLVSKADYGVYTAALNKLSFFLLISGIGMTSAVLQLCSEKAEDKVENERLYRYGSSIGINFNILLALIIIIGAAVLPESIKNSNNILMLLAFIPFLEIINEFQKVYFRSRLDNKSFSYANSIGTFFIVVLSVVGSLIYGIIGLIVGRYIAAVINIAVTKIYLKGPVYLKIKKDEKIDRSTFFKISTVSMLNGGISELLYLFDILVIGAVSGMATLVADYKIAIIIPSALVFIPASICMYIYPYFSLNKDNREWLSKKFNFLMLSLGGFNFLITAFLFIFAPQIISILFGENYLGAVTMFRISSVNYFFLGTFRIISGNLLVTQRKLTFNFYVALISGIFNIIGNYIFVTEFGAVGATWTTLMITATTGIVSTIYFLIVIKNK